MPSQYRVLPGPTSVSAQGGRKGLSPSDAAAEHYANMINAQAAQGWTFVCFDSTVVHRVECCNNATYTIKLLVFRRDDT